MLERAIGPAFIEKIHDAHVPETTNPNEFRGITSMSRIIMYTITLTSLLCLQTAATISELLMIILNPVSTISLHHRITTTLRLR